MEHKTDLVYKASSPYAFFLSLLWRGVLLLGMLYLSLSYSENPPVIIGIGIVLFILFIMIGNDEICIYRDRIVLNDTSIWQMFRQSAVQTFLINEIENATLPPKSSLVDITFLAVIIYLLPRRTYGDTDYYFFLDMKDGTSVRVNTTLGPKKVEKIVEMVNLARQ